MHHKALLSCPIDPINKKLFLSFQQILMIWKNHSMETATAVKQIQVKEALKVVLLQTKLMSRVRQYLHITIMKKKKNI
jgi:hypothetical protein